MNAEDLKRRHNLLVTADRYDDLAFLRDLNERAAKMRTEALAEPDRAGGE